MYILLEMIQWHQYTCFYGMAHSNVEAAFFYDKVLKMPGTPSNTKIVTFGGHIASNMLRNKHVSNKRIIETFLPN